jgi:hypothetical protein
MQQSQDNESTGSIDSVYSLYTHNFKKAPWCPPFNVRKHHDIKSAIEIINGKKQDMVHNLAINAQLYNIGEQIVWDPANMAELDQSALFDIQVGDIEKRLEQA